MPGNRGVHKVRVKRSHLGAANLAPVCEAVLVKVLGELGGLARSGLAHDDDNLVVAENLSREDGVNRGSPGPADCRNEGGQGWRRPMVNRIIPDPCFSGAPCGEPRLGAPYGLSNRNVCLVTESSFLRTVWMGRKSRCSCIVLLRANSDCASFFLAFMMSANWLSLR